MKLQIQNSDEIARKCPEFTGIKEIMLSNNGPDEIKILNPDATIEISLKKPVIHFHVDGFNQTEIELIGFVYNQNTDSFKQIRIWLK